jgi:hypothetical protein
VAHKGNIEPTKPEISSQKASKFHYDRGSDPLDVPPKTETRPKNFADKSIEFVLEIIRENPEQTIPPN